MIGYHKVSLNNKGIFTVERSFNGCTITITSSADINNCPHEDAVKAVKQWPRDNVDRLIVTLKGSSVIVTSKAQVVHAVTINNSSDYEMTIKGMVLYDCIITSKQVITFEKSSCLQTKYSHPIKLVDVDLLMDCEYLLQ